MGFCDVHVIPGLHAYASKSGIRLPTSNYIGVIKRATCVMGFEMKKIQHAPQTEMQHLVQLNPRPPRSPHLCLPVDKEIGG